MSSPDVALIAPYPLAGSRHEGRSGVASYTANLAHALAGAGAEVSVIAPREGREPVLSTDGPVRVERRFDRGARALPAAARAARAGGAEVSHLQHELFLYGGPESVPGLVPGLELLRRGGSGPVVTMHHVVDPASIDADFMRLHGVRAPATVARRGLGGVQAAIRRRAARVIVHEPAFARTVAGAVVVPHGIEQVTPPDRAEARARLGLDDRLTALCFGFIAPYKGLELALEAVTNADPDRVRMIVAGGDHPRFAEAGEPYAADLRRRYGQQATFTGRVPESEVGDWFAAADIALFLHPDPFSSSGALALALAYGTPALLSQRLAESVGAPDELVAPAEPDLLAAQLERLAERPAALASLRERAAGLAHEREWPAVARRHLNVYREVSDAQRATGRRLRAA